MDHNEYCSPFKFSREKLIRIPGRPINLRCLTGDEARLLNLVNRAVAVTPGIAAVQSGMTNAAAKKILEKLCSAKYLQKYASREDSRLVVYLLGPNGQELLNCKKREILTPLQLKKILAANQFLNLHNAWAKPENVRIRPLVCEAELRPGYFTDRAFRPDAMVQKEDHTLFVFSVRSDAAALETLHDDLEAAERTLFSPARLNFETRDSRVVLVCEDPGHQERVAAELQACAFPVYLTNDHDAFNGIREMRCLEKKSVAHCAADRIAAILEEAF